MKRRGPLACTWNLLPLCAAAISLAAAPVRAAEARSDRPAAGSVRVRHIDPPEEGFYAREVDYKGIPIKAPAVVDDRALIIARGRLEMMLKHIPNVAYNLRVAGAELHIIGKDQVTSDLPEFRRLKGKPFDGKLTVDQRTRGLGGLQSSCGEENLLQLPGDRYAGRDICVHEFAHDIQDNGISDAVRQQIMEQYRKSLAEGHWTGAYAASNVSEYFAELTMWYFGTHGDLHMTGAKPANGPAGLKAYDPEAYSLLDALYSGRIRIPKSNIVDLKALAPSREPHIRSGASTGSTIIRFFNCTDKEVHLYTLDSAGARADAGTLPPASSRIRRAFPSQVWVAADSEGQGLALFVAKKPRCVAYIRPPGR
ncbi:MAG TPA: hypothetical protein VGS41_15030 [Chthonomonadales bacterium]|nr:hypothetical protein [Chthonomonadales bacterium]